MITMMSGAMSKRFVDTERDRVAMRGVDVKLRFAFEWLWKNCDAAGVWKMDADLFRFECGYKLEVAELLKACPRVRQLPSGSLFLVDFIEVNYGPLKPGYNPHKPVFRSLEANSIQDLANPCLDVQEVDGEEATVQRQKERAPAEPPAINWPAWAGERTRTAWEDFKVYRWQQHKVRYRSATTEQKAVNILAKYFRSGPECVAALEHAMGKTWQFPVDPSEYKYPQVDGVAPPSPVVMNANGRPQQLKPWVS